MSVEQKYTVRQLKIIPQYEKGIFNHKKLNGKLTFNDEYGETALQLSLDSETCKEIMSTAIDIILRKRTGKVIEGIKEKLEL